MAFQHHAGAPSELEFQISSFGRQPWGWCQIPHGIHKGPCVCCTEVEVSSIDQAQRARSHERQPANGRGCLRPKDHAGCYFAHVATYRMLDGFDGRLYASCKQLDIGQRSREREKSYGLADQAFVPGTPGMPPAGQAGQLWGGESDQALLTWLDMSWPATQPSDVLSF